MALPKTLQPVGFEPRTVIASFIEEYEYGPSVKTVAFHRDNTEFNLLPFLLSAGVQDIADVTPEIMRGYMVKQQEAGLAPWTISGRFYSALRLFNWCIEQGYIDLNPMARMKRPKTPERVKNAFTRKEVQRMMKVLAAKPGWLGARDRAIVAVLLGTGARASELTSIRLREIDWPRRRIVLHGKGSKDRRVPMGKETMRALRDYIRVRPAVATDNVFVTQRKDPMEYSAAEVMVRYLGKYAGVEPCHLHRFRHTFATEFYLRNRDIIALKGMLGHTSVEMTMRYLASLGIDYHEAGNYASPDEWLVT
jgi:integrase/recombinase XerD